METKWRFFIILFVGAFILLGGSVESLDAQTRLGIRGGIYFDRDEPFVGGHLLHELDNNWIFNPNFEYILVETGSLYTINFDLHHDLPSKSNTIFWFGGGLGINRFILENFSNTDLGLNILMGMSFGRGRSIPFLQFKVMVFEETELALGAGITF